VQSFNQWFEDSGETQSTTSIDVEMKAEYLTLKMKKTSKDEYWMMNGEG
jgi:hypothetical protein